MKTNKTVALDKKVADKSFFNEEQKKMINDVVYPGITTSELQIFSHVCKKTGLDPFLKQIYAIKRGGVMTIQTGIDGYRFIADKTGKYSPGTRKAEFEYDDSGKLKSATAFVKKMTPDGTWHEIPAEAFLEEYVQKSHFWVSKTHVMLRKCAESLAIRQAFPYETSGLYTSDEMPQADIPEEATNNFVESNEETVSLSEDDIKDVKNLIGDDKELMDRVLSYIERRFKITKLEHLKQCDKESLCDVLIKQQKQKLEKKEEKEEKIA